MTDEIEMSPGKAVDPRLVSHLENVRVQTIEAEDSVPAALPEVKLPKTLKAAHEALAAARDEENPVIRKHKRQVLQDHIHTLSQVPKPELKNLRELQDSQNEAAEEIQLEMIGRQYPLVKKTLDSLNAQIETLKTKKT